MLLGMMKEELEVFMRFSVKFWKLELPQKPSSNEFKTYFFTLCAYFNLSHPNPRLKEKNNFHEDGNGLHKTFCGNHKEVWK